MPSRRPEHAWIVSHRLWLLHRNAPELWMGRIDQQVVFAGRVRQISDVYSLSI
jgi:hypothetical protein